MAAGDVITIIEDSMAKKGNYFDGTDDYVLHDAHAVARVAAADTQGTYSFWFYRPSGASSTLLSIGDNDSVDQYMKLQAYSNGSINITLVTGGAIKFQVYAAVNVYNFNTWTHVAFVQDGVQPKLYVNGVNKSGTNGTATDLTLWFAALTTCDKCAIGVTESNGTHTDDFTGAIGQVKYWNRALSAAEVLADYNGQALYQDSTYLQFNVTMANNGTTDSGIGLDNGTLTGNAHYGGYISAHSIALEANTTGHAAERSISTDISPSKTKTIIVRGD
jgi:hypothetical protein